MKQGWIGVDFDGTLVCEADWNLGQPGPPIPAMVARVKQWLADGDEVRIVTTRVAVVPKADGTPGAEMNDYGQEADALFAIQQRDLIRRWCQEHLGCALVVQAGKDFQMRELWDDRAIQLVPNTGTSIADIFDRQLMDVQRRYLARITELESLVATMQRALGADPDAVAPIL